MVHPCASGQPLGPRGSSSSESADDSAGVASSGTNDGPFIDAHNISKQISVFADWQYRAGVQQRSCRPGQGPIG